ncbi:hypothetical protein BS333_03770 [Vibrio azureus]|uniref:Uncharacterized protein n=1 Tax=Vibrio azureus NBRC 104587 TaxID=1219077 RepID=U3AX50_9VIBR|nr:hypothetical protein [Vibrio azureus]AUI85557.1 hypothetical protein BS333_03770 [Vibrio azureus]GAD77797.1 hypothetical protein VAZ01S_093_00020 [Vibrio azureus NBRC 104587]
MNRYWNILSIKNRHKVKQDVQKLHHLNNFASIAIALVLRSGKSAWISSSPKVALHTEVTGLSRGDLLLSPSFINGKDTTQADDVIEIDEIQKNINHILEGNGIYRCYNII